MKRFAQIAAVAGALSMLVGFVVYSQQKADMPDGSFKVAPAAISTNAAAKAAPAPAVAPSSKSRAPLLPPAVPPGFTIRSAPSSKSGLVITPEQITREVAPKVLEVPQKASFWPTGQFMYATKSAPVITPSMFLNERAVAMAASNSLHIVTGALARHQSISAPRILITNPPPRKATP